MREVSLSSADWTDLASDDGGFRVVGRRTRDGSHQHQHDGLGMHTHGHGHGPEIAQLANDDGGQGFGSLDFRDLDATPDEIGAVLDAAAEADAEMAAEALAALPDDDLDALAAEGRSYPADLAPGGDFSRWMDSLDSREFANIREEAVLTGEAEFDYLRAARAIDMAAAGANGREGTRQQQDAAERERRTGARHRRPSDEVLLANGLDRYAAGTYLYGQQPADLAADPDVEGLLGVSQATVLDAENELRYQILGGLPPARSRPQPGLPPVSGLARTLGLHA